MREDHPHAHECSIDFASLRIEIYTATNNYRSRLVVSLVSIAVAGDTAALRQTRRHVAFGFRRLMCEEMLGAKLGFRVLITSTDLLPSTAVSGILAAGFGPSAMLEGPPPDTARQAFSLQLPLLNG